MTAAPRITIEKCRDRIQIVVGGETVADTQNALILREGSYPPVYYLPPGDVRRELLCSSDHRTHCPHKGDASYWSLEGTGAAMENLAWSYEDPLEQVQEIKGHFAFYPDKADIRISAPDCPPGAG